MPILKGLIRNLPRNFIACFSGINLLWQAIAIGLTYLIVASGFDWTWYTFFQHGLVFQLTFPAVFLGVLLPVAVPLTLLIKGRHNAWLRTAGFATAQAPFIAWLITAIYKALTGRAHPEVFMQSATDISRVFHFGFLRAGIFWGWPSSHTAAAFALAFALIMLFPKSRAVKILAILGACYIGFGVSMSIHWFSDFIAGAIVGTVAGIVVGRSFVRNQY